MTLFLLGIVCAVGAWLAWLAPRLSRRFVEWTLTQVLR